MIKWPFEITSLVLVLAVSVTGWFVSGSYKLFTGILAGGFIGIINFKWLGSIVKGALSEDNTVRYTINYLLKFLFIITGIAMFVYYRLVDPLGLIVGFTLIVALVLIRGTELIRS